MDFKVIQDNIPLFIEGMKTTLYLGFSGILLSIIIGFICALSRYFKIPFISKLVSIYTELARNTPLLIQIFFLYYGLPKAGIPIGKNTAAIVGLTFLGAAYIAESFLSGFNSVPQVQVESAKSIGFNRLLLTREVILPQGLPIAIPSLGANCIFLLKETSVFSAISIMDLTNTAKDLIGMYYMTREFLFMLVVSYAVIIIPMIWIINFLEKRVQYAVNRL